MAKRRVLLTGATGYIASQMLPTLREQYDLTLVFACGTIAGVLTAYTSRAEGFSERDVRLAGAIAQEIGLEFSRNDPFLGYDFTALDEMAASPRANARVGANDEELKPDEHANSANGESDLAVG